MTRASRRSTPTRRRVRRFVVAAVILIITGYLLPQLFAVTGAFILYPVDRVSVWVRESSASLPQYLRDRTALLAEIKDLESQLAGTAGARLSLSRLSAENARLRALLGEQVPERTLGRVIGRPPDLAYDHLQLNIGRADGVAVGAPVFTGVDTVVGTIVHVGEHHAFAELATAPGFSSTAYVLGPDVFATLEGVGGGVARVLLPQGIRLETGQLVLLPTIESGVYGEVVAVENLPTQPEQYGYVAPAVPLASIRYVTVGRAPPAARTVPEIEAAVRDGARAHFAVSTSTRRELGVTPTSTATGTPTATTAPPRR